MMGPKCCSGPSNAEGGIPEHIWDRHHPSSQVTPKIRWQVQTRALWVKRSGWMWHRTAVPNETSLKRSWWDFFKDIKVQGKMREVKITKLWDPESLWIRIIWLSSPDRAEFQAHSKIIHEPQGLYKGMLRKTQESMTHSTSGTESKAMGGKE